MGFKCKSTRPNLALADLLLKHMKLKVILKSILFVMISIE